MKKHLVGTK